MRDRLYVHICWTTRGRARVLDRRVAEFLSEFLPVVCRQERARLLEIGIVASHVHLLVRLHPTTSIPRLLQRMKGGSSVIVNRADWTLTSLRWAKGYNVDTVSCRSLDAARSYVINQHRRHPQELLEGWEYGRQFTDISRAAASSREQLAMAADLLASKERLRVRGLVGFEAASSLF